MNSCAPLTVVLFWLVAGSVAQAGQIIDQQYTPDPVPNHVNIDTVRGFLSGQSFLPSLPGVDFVVLNIEAAGGHATTPPGSYLVEIRQGQGDSGPLLGTSNPVLLPTGLPPTNVEFDFSTVVPLIPGDLYSLVVNNANPGSGSNFLVGYSTAAGYPAGSGFGSATGDYDLYFQEGLIVPEPATLGMLATGFAGAGLLRWRRKRPQRRANEGNNRMRFSILASMAVALACSLGCDRKPDPKVNVDAPGVKVNVDPDRGVSVQAPGVDVQTSPSGAKVDVAPDRAK